MEANTTPTTTTETGDRYFTDEGALYRLRDGYIVPEVEKPSQNGWVFADLQVATARPIDRAAAEARAQVPLDAPNVGNQFPPVEPDDTRPDWDESGG